MKRVKKKNQVYLIVAIVIIVALLVFGSAYYYVFKYVHQYKNNQVVDGVYIEEYSIGHMSRDNIEEIIQQITSKNESSSFEITSENTETPKVSVKFEEVELKVANLEELIDEAISYGKSGGLLTRYKEIKLLEEQNKVLHLTYQFNEEKVINLILEKFKNLETKPIDAYIEVENGKLVHKGGNTGIILEEIKTAQLLEEQLKQHKALGEISIPIQTKVQEPEVTLESLETIQDELGSYKTTCRNTGGRYKNVQRGAELLNGRILKPGDSISVQEVTSPYTVENGYFEAGAFENGEVIQSLAGGICQLCTTAYNAVLNAELEVTQRQAHSMLVSYVDPARDAAIAGTYKDLKFKNNLETPIYIYANLSNEILEVRIYGQDKRADNREIKFQSITTGPGESAKTKYEINTGASAGSKICTSNGQEGKVAELWKYIYVDGVEVDKVKVNTSRYIGKAASYSIGVKSEYPEVTSLLVNAVKSNDEATINNAITQAQELTAKKNAEKEALNKPLVPPTPTPTVPSEPTEPTVPQEPAPPEVDSEAEENPSVLESEDGSQIE